MSEELKRGIPKGRCIGHDEFTPEQRRKNAEEFEAYLRETGQLKDGEHMQEVDFDLLRRKFEILQKKNKH